MDEDEEFDHDDDDMDEDDENDRDDDDDDDVMDAMPRRRRHSHRHNSRRHSWGACGRGSDNVCWGIPTYRERKKPTPYYFPPSTSFPAPFSFNPPFPSLSVSSMATRA